MAEQNRIRLVLLFPLFFAQAREISFSSFSSHSACCSPYRSEIVSRLRSNDKAGRELALCIYDFTVECLRLRDEEEEGYEIGYGRRSCTFLFSCFREKQLYNLFLEELFFLFFKIVARNDGWQKDGGDKLDPFARRFLHCESLKVYFIVMLQDDSLQNHTLYTCLNGRRLPFARPRLVLPLEFQIPFSCYNLRNSSKFILADQKFIGIIRDTYTKIRVQPFIQFSTPTNLGSFVTPRRAPVYQFNVAPRYMNEMDFSRNLELQL